MPPWFMANLYNIVSWGYKPTSNQIENNHHIENNHQIFGCFNNVLVPIFAA